MVKPAAPREHGIGVQGGPGSSDPGHIAYNHAALWTLISLAYEPKPHQLSAPSWTLSEFFDIEAKVPPGATKEDLPVMLQSLLEERFKVKVHHETREGMAHALRVTPGGARTGKHASPSRASQSRSCAGSFRSSIAVPWPIKPA